MSLASKLIDNGIDSIDVSMLPVDYKKQILTEVAELLFNQGRLEDCAKTISKSCNPQKQVEFGIKFMAEGRPALAVEALLNSGAKDLIKKAGIACMNNGNRESAIKAFDSIEDKEMKKFIEENF
ncbi:MAG: hypothetical protein Q8L01_03115 [Candidatus Woesebacteria bacterium]|nr:hypothetical protein [Candidatus Woesebacteria bacterium]